MLRTTHFGVRTDEFFPTEPYGSTMARARLCLTLKLRTRQRPQIPDTDHLLMDAEHRTLLRMDDCRGLPARVSNVGDSFYAIYVLAHVSRSHFARDEAETEAARYRRRGFHCRNHE
jgi:hypothetical protein